jgi:quinolinate synthase
VSVLDFLSSQTSLPHQYRHLSREEMEERVRRLKKVFGTRLFIPGHHYQKDEVIQFADATGDSLQLAQISASNHEAEYIIFCGVHFMAESAKILSPHKTVLLPVRDAGCPMADMVTAQGIREMKEKYPDAAVVTYVNSSAEVKAESDICCTSSNAARGHAVHARSNDRELRRSRRSPPG